MKGVKLLTVLLVAELAFLGTACAQKSNPLKPPGKSTLVSGDVKHLLLLMDTNKDGKITKQEWMRFMEAEFDRLDKDKSGELDPKELMASQVSLSPKRPSNVGK